MTTLNADLLLRAYASGIFPMADDAAAQEVYWVEPKKRGVLPLDQFHLSHSLTKTLKSGRFTTSVDLAFEDVLNGCADREETWINRQIADAVVTLRQIGHAHSIEVWEDTTLIGGLYGVTLGHAFFGESMFSRATDASKVALAHLVARMRIGGFTLLDCQFITPHLASLGAIEISQKAYCALLSAAVATPPSAGTSGGGAAVFSDFFAFDAWCADVESVPPSAFWAPGGGSPWFIWHALTQTS